MEYLFDLNISPYKETDSQLFQQRQTALCEAVNNPVKTFAGSNKQIEIMLEMKRKIQILFIVNHMNEK